MFALVWCLVLAPAPAGGAGLHPCGGLFKDPATVPWLVRVKPDAAKSDPPPSVDHSAHMPPVGSQGSLPSCTSWALGYYYKTYQEWLERGWDVSLPAHQFSPTFLYNQSNAGGNIGSYYTDNMRVMVDFGCATFADCPDSPDPVPWPSDTAYAHAAAFRCSLACYIDCSTDSGLVALKQHIADGDNAVLPINVWSNFDNIDNFDTCYCAADRYGSNRGGHYITFVGYDDSRPTHDGAGAFRFVNSWGTGWGNAGYAWMSYVAVKNTQLSYRTGLFLVDLLHYTPRVLARARLTHASREDVHVDMGVGPASGPSWSHQYFRRDLARITGHPFPDHDIVFDLTDGAPYLNSLDTNGLYISAQDIQPDGVTGTIDSFTAVSHDWAASGRAAVTGVPIPDDGTAAGTSLELPGRAEQWQMLHRLPAHCGATELAGDIDSAVTLWTAGAGSPVTTSPVIADLDGDGRMEVAFGAADSVVRVVNGEDGSPAWSDTLTAPVSAALAAGDIDGDGAPELVAAADDGTVSAWRGADGSPRWTAVTGAAVVGGVTLGDCNGDGVNEVIVGTAAGAVWVLSGADGGVCWSRSLGSAVGGAPAFADANSDGRLDVVVGTAAGRVYVLDAETGDSTTACVAGAAVMTAAAVADLDGDGRNEVVAGTDAGTVVAFNPDSAPARWTFTAGGAVRSSPAVGDINGGGPEVVAGADDGDVYALNRDGAMLWSHPLGAHVRSAPALGDVDGNGTRDVVVVADNGTLSALDGATGMVLFDCQAAGTAGSSPALGDLDGDGKLEIAVASGGGGLVALGGPNAGAVAEPVMPTGQRGATLSISPNPARGAVVIRYSFTAALPRSIGIYDRTGRLVRSLAVSRQPSAVNSIVWDGTDDSGRRVAPGVYFVRLVTPGRTVNVKAVMTR